MAVAGIVLESQVSGGKVMSVDPDGSGTEGTSLIPLRHEIKGSISIDKDRLVTAGTLKSNIRTGDYQLFPINSFTDMQDHRRQLRNGSRELLSGF